jgi:hypothetical protein
MAEVLTNLGEEYIIDLLVGTTLDIGLFDDSSSAIGDTDDLSDLTATEPSNGNYARQSVTVQSGDVSKLGGNYGFTVSVTFDVSDTTGSVDSTFAVVNFQADEASDSGATDHLFGTANLSMTRDLSQNDTLNVDFEFTLD